MIDSGGEAGAVMWRRCVPDRPELGMEMIIERVSAGMLSSNGTIDAKTVALRFEFRDPASGAAGSLRIPLR